MNAKTYTHDLWVVNCLGRDNKPYMRTIQSVFPCPSQAADAFTALNRNMYKVVGYNGIKLDDAPRELTPNVPLAEPLIAKPEAPEAEGGGYTVLLEDSVSWKVDGSDYLLHLFAEYDVGRCEVTMSYHLNSECSYDLTLVANSLATAIRMARVLTMHGNLTHAIRRLLTLAQMRKSCEQRFQEGN